uniref:Titin n=1 Tax=Macrostomum lignano TaxID=282301 RepID=A0A1I8GZ19_9PLAT
QQQQQHRQGAVGEAPRFVRQPRPSASVSEGAAVRIDCRVAPLNDSSMQAEWCKDGLPLNAGSRLNTTFERGYVSLDILHTYPEDSGEYSCVVRSSFGMDQSNPMSLTVVAEEGVVTDTQLPEQSMVANIDRLDERLSARSTRQDYDDRIPQSAPQFVRQIDSAVVAENSSVRFETRVTPAADSNIQVEWYKNGVPVTLGSRIRAVYDRGYTALEMIYCYPEDSGLYCCLATNKHGSAQSNTAQLSCSGSAGVVTASALPASSVMNIQRLEEYGEEFRPMDADLRRADPPRFLAPLSPAQLQVPEAAAPAAFSARADPGNGNRVQAHWFCDGVLVQFGSRITAGFELGLAWLKFAYVNSEDSGTYCAVLESEHGQAQSTAAQLVCQPGGTGVVTSSQLPGNAEHSIRSLMQLEEEMATGRAAMPGADAQQQPPPVIVRGLVQPPELKEGERLGLQLQIEPARDGNLSVDWLKDGQAVTLGSRVHTDCERGLAWLQIGHCYAEDSGQYWAVVRNRSGAVESNRVAVLCHASESVVTRTQLPGGAQGFQRLEDLERQWREAPIGPEEFQFREFVEPQSQPHFDIMPESVTVCEGYPAKFLVKLSGFPRPRVAWYLNEQMIASVSPWILSYR